MTGSQGFPRKPAPRYKLIDLVEQEWICRILEVLGDLVRKERCEKDGVRGSQHPSGKWRSAEQHEGDCGKHRLGAEIPVRQDPRNRGRSGYHFDATSQAVQFITHPQR